MNQHSINAFEFKRAMRPFVGILYSLARFSATGNILEIGVRQGQSTRTILGALSDRGSGKLTSIDIRARDERVPDELRPFWNQVVGNSHDQSTLDAVKGLAPFDFILVDGDHAAEGVKRDWEMYGGLTNGLVIFHDIVNPEGGDGGVKEFWERNLLDCQRISIPVWPGMGIVQV